MKSTPNPIGLVLWPGFTVTVFMVLSAPAGQHLSRLFGGLVATGLLVGIVALGVWATAWFRARRSS